MPYLYQHDNVDDATHPTRFECTLQCEGCAASTLGGAPCRRVVCIWLPFCWQHTRSVLGVRTGPSQALPGATGLFADRDFRKGEMVAPYVGEVITEAEVERRYGSLAPYLLYQVDTACRRGIASAANGEFGRVTQPYNVKFEPTCHRMEGVKEAGSVYKKRRLSRSNLGVKYWSWATRPILKGDEIIAGYGTAAAYEDYAERFLEREQVCASLGLPCDVTRRVSRRKARAK